MDNDSLSVISDYDCEDGATAIQAHARRKYLWGVNGECSDNVLKVFELRNVIGSMRHALSIVRYVQFLVDHSELLEIVSKCKD